MGNGGRAVSGVLIRMQQAVTREIFMSPHRDSGAIIDGIDCDDCVWLGKRNARSSSRLACLCYDEIVEQALGFRRLQI